MELQNRNVIRTRVDSRLTRLPDELLIKILSLLPTKDAAAISIFSKRLRHVFFLLTTLDFDSSLTTHCLKHIKHSTFVTFVDTVLKEYRSNHLKKFRLQIGRPDYVTPYSNARLPDLDSLNLNEWISFPLNFIGLRELDLCILVKEPGEAQLPSAIFTCETLEVLKLQVNIGLDEVISMPAYRLPNLKVLLLLASSSPDDDDFLPRLVSSCPVLEDLTFQPFPSYAHNLFIYPPSLRRLCMYMNELGSTHRNYNDLVPFSYPNSEYLDFVDYSRCMYSIPMIPFFVKEALTIPLILLHEEIQLSFEQMISLIKPLSYVQHLSLLGCFFQGLDYDNEKVLTDQLPVFRNLKHLELSCSGENHNWDKLLLPLLISSPVLETLVFPWGLMEYYHHISSDPREFFVYSKYNSESVELELEYFRAARAIPSCCRHHLKRIVIKEYYGLYESLREVEIIKFFLRQALVLEELVIFRALKPRIPIPDQMLIENTLKTLPRASTTCSIQVL